MRELIIFLEDFPSYLYAFIENCNAIEFLIKDHVLFVIFVLSIFTIWGLYSYLDTVGCLNMTIQEEEEMSSRYSFREKVLCIHSKENLLESLEKKDKYFFYFVLYFYYSYLVACIVLILATILSIFISTFNHIVALMVIILASEFLISVAFDCVLSRKAPEGGVEYRIERKYRKRNR